MKFLKKVLTKTVHEKVRAYVYLAILVLGIGSLIALARYTIPFYDDFSYGINAKNSMSSTSDFIGAIKGAASGTKTMWYAWQGTHSSIFFMNLMPGIFGEKYYFLGPVMLILLLAGSTFLFTHVLLRVVLKADKWNSLALQCLVSGFVVLYIYAANQAFFWYNAGVHYTAMHSLLLLLITCLVGLMYSKFRHSTVWLTIVSVILGVLIGGSNYVTALQCGLIFASMALIGMLKKKKNTLLFIPSIIAYGVSFYYNVIAPGNNVRASHYWYVEKSAPKALIGSFKEAVKWGKEFSNWKTMLVVFLMIPVIWVIVKKTRYVFKLWKMLVLIAWSLCFFASGFTSSLYATGSVDLARVINVIKINYHLLLVVNAIYAIGFVYQVVKNKSKNADKNILLKWKGGLAWPLIVLWVGAYFFFYTNEIDPIGNYSVFGACYYLKTGQAKQFYEEYEARLEILKDNSITNVEFEPYTVKPWFLINKDVSTDATDEQNVFMAAYYGKESIRLKE